MSIPSVAALRHAALAVCVMHDVDLVPLPGGIELGGPVPVRVSWGACVRALRGADPAGEEGRRLLAAWLRTHALFAVSTPEQLAARMRPLGLPVGHVLHPGPGWARADVLGGALELGLGLTGLEPDRPDDITAAAPGVWPAHGLDPAAYWPAAAAYLSQMARLAAERRLLLPADALRPMGDCDVVTLLCHREFRIAVTGPSGDMAAVGAPMRTRGWTDLRRIDPAFVVSAAAATDPVQRGFHRPLLVTADEVVMVAEGGRPVAIALLDPAPDQPWLRPMRYR